MHFLEIEKQLKVLETAEIAMKAALTGHLVLSTLHTNSAPDTISRLLNMGVAPFNLVAALNCITAQRLVKTICPDCRVEDDSVTEEAFLQVGIPKSFVKKVKAYKGRGCSTCHNSGMKGRAALHEVLIMNDAVKRSIIKNEAVVDIKKVAMKTGMRTLRQSALTKMVKGVTTIAEVIRTTSSDSEKES